MCVLKRLFIHYGITFGNNQALKHQIMKTIYEKSAKKIFLFLFLVNFSMLSMATVYYVSNTGNDINPGLTSALPWQTLAKVNAATFKAGDQILFNRGETFYGTLNARTSGTSGNPITYGAYGTGLNPIISGFTTISGWINEGGGIYSKVITSDAQTNMVAMDGVNTAMGRFPNADYLTYESFSTNTSITDNQLPGTPDWTGAEVAVRTTDFSIDRGTISSHSGTIITYTNISSGRNGQANYGYFIQNDLRTLDQFGEWYHNTGTGKFYMYFGAVNPTTKTVKVATKTNVIYHYNSSGSSPDYIVYDNLNIEGAIDDGIIIYNGSIYNTIQNCTFNFCGKIGIEFRYSADYNTVNNNTILNCTSASIFTPATSDNLTITNNTISNNGLILGSSKGTEGYYSSVGIKSDNNLIQYNSISYSGYNGISLGGNNNQIRNNFINYSCINFNDGGGIYTAGTHTSIVIDGNIILNSIGTNSGTPVSYLITEGIYLDEYANGITIQNNTIANCVASGIKLHKAHDNVISNNTCYNNGVGIYLFNSVTGTTMVNNAISGNLFISKSATQYPFFFESRLYNDISFGTANNNYYARPIDDNTTIRTDNTSRTNRTLAQWQAFSGHDANSHKSPQTIASENDFQFEYNETTSAKTVTLSQPMTDIKGTKYIGTITLQPYTSVVLMKDNNPILTDTTLPVIASFTIPTTSSSPTISIATLSGTDNIGITGYLLTETATAPSSIATGWSSILPTTYTFSSIGTKSLYAWAKDAAGNVSIAVKADVVILSPVASTYIFTGPSSGNVYSASANYTITPNSLYTGTITITPTGTGSAGLSAKVLTFSNSAIAQTLTFTPTVAGSITLSASNNGTLTNPVSLTYIVNPVVPGTPGSVVAVAGNTTSSVSFLAPVNNGGSVITVYSVTSLPADGVDINAGSTLLTHSITGLVNGTSYTFTVKASNSAGSSAASAASNAVTPVSVSSTEYIAICEGNSYNGWMITGKYSRTIAAKVAGDSIVTTYLTVNPKYTITEEKTIDEGLDYNSWTTSGQYSRILSSVSGCDSTVVTNLTVVANSTKQGILYTQTIDLKKGYNMISTYVDASNSSVSTVTQPIRDNGMLIKMQDESGNSYENMGNLAGWVDNMGSILETEGYKIRVAADCSLQVTGTEIALPLDIPLNMGWNIVSFPRTDVLDGMNMIQSLIDQNILIKVQDEAGNSIENWGIYGGWKNSIGNLIPGKAYRVKVSAGSVLTIQQSYPKSAILPVFFEQTSHFLSLAEGNGYEHMNINLVGLSGSGLVAGDELAAYDGVSCVGTLKITQQQLNQGSASLIASCSTGSQLKDGYKEGASIQIRAWNQVTNSETPIQTSILSGSLNYLKNASTLVKMKAVTTSAFELKDVAQVEVFPNPSQGLFTVRFSDLPDSGSHIDIYDLSGRKVASHLIEGISEDFNLSDQAAGVYLVKSILGSQEKVSKLVIQ